MKESLSPQEEKLIETFAFDIAMVDTVNQMFPPDGAGDSERRRPLSPLSPTCEQICLAAVYDLNAVRRRSSQRLMIAGDGILERIDVLV